MRVCVFCFVLFCLGGEGGGGWGEERLNVRKIVQRQGLYVTNPPLFPQFMIKID